jgi:hypothetical protein
MTTKMSLDRVFKGIFPINRQYNFIEEELEVFSTATFSAPYCALLSLT